MELELSEDQEFFLETTRKFLAAEAPAHRRPRPRAEPPTASTRLVAPGLRARLDLHAGAPRRDGGGSLSEHGLLDLVLVAEEMGRLVSPGPLTPGEPRGLRPGGRPAPTSSAPPTCPASWAAT